MNITHFPSMRSSSISSTPIDASADPQPACLETLFPPLVFPEEIRKDEHPFFQADFLEPNEKHPEELTAVTQPFLDDTEAPGFIVSAGTERSFFHLALCDTSKILGLIVRDVSWHVKAYVDMNVLLLRIAKDVEEYAALSKSLTGEERKQELFNRLEIILSLLASDDTMPEETKAYYVKNLHTLAEVYYSSQKEWRDKNAKYFAHVRYDIDPKLFEKLQSYAREGNIVATCGDINSLEPFNTVPLLTVDVSNIPHYTPIHLHTAHEPLIIWTNFTQENTRYFSFRHTPIPLEDKEYIDHLLQALDDSKELEKMSLSSVCCKGLELKRLVSRKLKIPDLSLTLTGYNPPFCTLLKDAFASDILYLQDKGWIYLPAKKVHIFNDYSEETIRDLSHCMTISRHIDWIARSWKFLKPSVYLAFSENYRWNIAFGQVYEKQHRNPAFQNHFRKNPCLFALIDSLFKDR